MGTSTWKSPFMSAVPVATDAPFRERVTVEPGAAMPEMVGVVSAVRPLLVGEVMVGCGRTQAWPPLQEAPLGQSALPTQRTHVLLAVLQAGVAPVQSLLVRHCTTSKM